MFEITKRTEKENKKSFRCQQFFFFHFQRLIQISVPASFFDSALSSVALVGKALDSFRKQKTLTTYCLLPLTFLQPLYADSSVLWHPQLSSNHPHVFSVDSEKITENV